MALPTFIRDVASEPCPRGYIPTFVRNCSLLLPFVECVFTSPIDYDCYVKSWKCASYEESGHYECQRPPQNRGR
jgi:hypothetical protein